MKKEIWLDIEMVDGLYQVSNLGRVRSMKFNKERILKPTDNGAGYLLVQLYYKGVRKSFLVHRLVLMAFKYDSEMEINHIDGNKYNNDLDNLEYCTRAYNISHRFKVLGHKQNKPNLGKYGNSHPKSKKISQYNENHVFIRSWDGVREASRELGVSATSISRCLNGKQNKCLGFIFKFSN